MTKFTKTIEDFSIEAIAESGQCFRIVPSDDGGYYVNAFGRVLKVKNTGEGNENTGGHESNGGCYEFSCGEEEFTKVWKDYFDLDTDYGAYRSLALPCDEYLKTAIAFGSGIRMLRQDPWEMLISFIISQRKSVPAIRTSVERLSENFGHRIETDFAPAFCSFPEAEALAKADTETLASCGLGYRIDYVRDTARMVCDGELDLAALNKLETPALIEELMKIKGVGIKVASCVALFGCHRLDTVPVDVWMKRVIDTVYHGSLPEEYRPYAGVLQQYMFNYARLNKVGI
ncbi:MAG: DNA glycosylase [Eubacteriales bacterium]|nr:DNA glycosylase [Eubacteriales bacterium]